MSVLICVHHPLEGPGVFGEELERLGIPYERLEFYREPRAKAGRGFSRLIIMGGPMNVDQTEEYPFLSYERELVRECIGRDRPVLGICLGAQTIARALGAKVVRNSVPEIGWHQINFTEEGRNDPLFAGFGPAETVFQWHEDTFERPQGSAWLAVSPLCPNQAFRFRKAYALQFHLETDRAVIGSWLKDENEPEKILADTERYVDRANRLARSFFLKWLEL